jgi:glycosyltransferase involved in cell wall biosynthesis
MSAPRVSVLTPVYNGEKYLTECIESVLAQDYKEFAYHIVNNCSTDRTLEIAESYASKDRRIQVWTNPTFVTAIENHNAGFRMISPDSRYCKVVSADDWIMPDCIRKMVQLAEEHPTVGIVGSYQRSGNIVKWKGIPSTVSIMPGRDAGRLGLLNGIHVLGTPTSVLYRADLLRMRKDFFPHPRSYADTSACYEALQHCDFGFLHEVLSVERVHPEQWSEAMYKLDAGSVYYLAILMQYGPRYLSAEEFSARKAEVFGDYYRGLGGCLLKLKGREFWDFHRSALRGMGYQLEWARIATAAIKEAVTEAKNPVTAMRKVLAVVTGKPTSG